MCLTKRGFPQHVIAAIAVVALCCGTSESAPKVVSEQVDAPFDLPEIKSPDFNGLPRFVISDHGAIERDQPSTSQALKQAIAEAYAADGGTVVVPRGEWHSGPIHLRDNVELHLEEGAVLEFSSDPSDYLPPVKTSWEGIECYNYSPLVYAYSCRNVAVTGQGKLVARLDTWKQWYARPAAHMEALKELYEMASTGRPIDERQMARGEANLRPHFLQFNRCENVLIEGVTIENSPFWVIHPLLSRNVVIRDVRVRAHGHNNDGVDPEMSENVLIEDCLFDQGDDAIAIKSGRNHDAWRLASPCRNIVVRRCRVRNGHQLVAIGSELSGGVENVLVEDCSVDKDIRNLGHLLYIKTNERRGGFVRNIHLRNVTSGDLRYGVLGIETDVLYQWRHLVPTHEVRLTEIRDIFVNGVQTGAAEFCSRILAQPDAPVRNVLLSDVSLEEVRGQEHRHENVEGFNHRGRTRVAKRVEGD